jgi:calcium/calmodulin-dependent protein kinase I
MDLCTGGELFDRICDIGSFFEKDGKIKRITSLAIHIIFTVTDAIHYLHSVNIVHRDIKVMIN